MRLQKAPFSTVHSKTICLRCQMSPLLRVFLNRFVLFSSVLVWDGRPKRVGKYSFSNENASVDVVSDLPYSYSHSLIVNLPGVSAIAGQNHFRFKLVHIAACYSCICTGEYVWKKLEISKTNYFCCYCYFFLLASGLREIQDGKRNWNALNYRQVFSPSCVILCFGCVLNSSIMVYLVSRYFW